MTTTGAVMSEEREGRTAPEDAIAGRASMLTALWALYVLTLRQHLHGKRWMVSTVLFLLPAVLAVCLRVTAPNVPGLGMEFMLAFMFIPQGLLPLVALLYASGVIQDEQEEQTITYLLIRPIPKPALYVVKLLATLTTTVGLTVLFTVLTYAAIYAGADREGQDVVARCAKAAGVHALAVSAYCCLFAVMSLFTRRTLVMGILYVVIFEGFLANMPLGVRMITVIYYARMIAYRTLSFIIGGGPEGFENLSAEIWRLDVVHDPMLAEHPTLPGAITVLVGASLAFTAVGAFLCWRREFHVKTAGQG